MSQAQHTQGPWTVDSYGNVEGPQGETIAEVRLWDGPANIANGHDLPESQANVNLIAAAPDLLAVLENLLNAGDSVTFQQRAREAARLAVAKARGE